MSVSFRRPIVSLLLAPYIALPGVALEHVHQPDADHPQSAVHRHVQPHASAVPDHDHAQLAGDAAHIVWVEGVALRQPAYQCAAPALSPVECIDVVPDLEDWAVPPDYDTAPPHGPPRACLSLRAPPYLFV